MNTMHKYRHSLTFKIDDDALNEELIELLAEADIDFDVRNIWKNTGFKTPTVDYHLLTIYDASKLIGVDSVFRDPTIFGDRTKEEKDA